MLRRAPCLTAGIGVVIAMLSGIGTSFGAVILNTNDYASIQHMLDLAHSAASKCPEKVESDLVESFLRAEAHHLGLGGESERQAKAVREFDVTMSLAPSGELCPLADKMLNTKGGVFPGLLVTKGQSIPAMPQNAMPKGANAFDLIEHYDDFAGKKVKVSDIGCAPMADGAPGGIFTCDAHFISQGMPYAVSIVGIDIPDEGSRKDLEIKCSEKNIETLECRRDIVFTPAYFSRGFTGNVIYTENLNIARPVGYQTAVKPDRPKPGKFGLSSDFQVFDDTLVGPKSRPDSQKLETSWNDKIIELQFAQTAAGDHTYMIAGVQHNLGFNEYIPRTVSSAVFADGSVTASALVATMLGRRQYCKDQPNSATSTSNFTECPVRALISTQDTKTLSNIGEACLVFYDKSNPGDVSFVSYDSASRTFHFVAFNDWKPIAGCDRKLAIDAGQHLKAPPAPDLSLVVDESPKVAAATGAAPPPAPPPGPLLPLPEVAAIKPIAIQGKSVDVLGITLGMTRDQAESILAANYGRGNVHSLAMTVSASGVNSAPFVFWTAAKKGGSGMKEALDEVNISYSSPSTGNRVLRIERHVNYGEALLKAPSIIDLREQMVEKYGEPHHWQYHDLGENWFLGGHGACENVCIAGREGLFSYSEAVNLAAPLMKEAKTGPEASVHARINPQGEIPSRVFYFTIVLSDISGWSQAIDADNLNRKNFLDKERAPKVKL